MIRKKYAVHTAAKQNISCHGKNKNGFKMLKKWKMHVQNCCLFLLNMQICDVMSLPSSWLLKNPTGGLLEKRMPAKSNAYALPIVSSHFKQIRRCLKKLINKTSQNAFLPTKHDKKKNKPKKKQSTQPVDGTRTRYCSCETPSFFVLALTHLHFLLHETKCVILAFRIRFPFSRVQYAFCAFTFDA